MYFNDQSPASRPWYTSSIRIRISTAAAAAVDAILDISADVDSHGQALLYRGQIQE